jgi:hypothetical protein
MTLFWWTFYVYSDLICWVHMMQAIFVTYNTSDPSRVTLQEFIIIFGAAQLVLSQLPDIHSLRWFNALCTFCTVAFTVVVMGLLIHAGITCSPSLHLTSSLWLFGLTVCPFGTHHVSVPMTKVGKLMISPQYVPKGVLSKLLASKHMCIANCECRS